MDTIGQPLGPICTDTLDRRMSNLTREMGVNLTDFAAVGLHRKGLNSRAIEVDDAGVDANNECCWQTIKTDNAQQADTVYHDSENTRSVLNAKYASDDSPDAKQH